MDARNDDPGSSAGFQGLAVRDHSHHGKTLSEPSTGGYTRRFGNAFPEIERLRRKLYAQRSEPMKHAV